MTTAASPANKVQRLYGGIEAGGTKINLAVATSPTDIIATACVRTSNPADTNAAIHDLFHAYRDDLVAIGVASFGPIRLESAAGDWGKLLATPKPGWSGASIVQPLIDAFAVPVGLETDVSAAALAEYRLGALQGMACGVYITVGTGIGAGIIVNGLPIRGSLHPEVGHIRIVRGKGDTDFLGCCPYHGDCLEGLASGPAIQQRWGASLSELPRDHPAHGVVADYLGQASATLALTLSPGRIVMGGGVSKSPGLHQAIAVRMRHWLGGYLDGLEVTDPEFVAAPTLADAAGVIGALIIAENATNATLFGR